MHERAWREKRANIYSWEGNSFLKYSCSKSRKMFRTENVMWFSFRNWKWEICQYILQKLKTTAKCPEWKVMHDRWNTILILWMQCHSMKTSAVASHKTTCITLWGVKAIIPFVREVVLATEFAKKCPSLARFPSFLSPVRQGCPYWYPVLKVGSWCPTFWANRVKHLFNGHFVEWSRLLPRFP